MTVEEQRLRKEGASYARPDEFLGESLREMDFDDGREVVKKKTSGPRQRSAEATDRPEFFLGGSGNLAPTGPKRKLRTTWLAGGGDGGVGSPKKDEPPPIPTPTKKWKPPANFKKVLPPKAKTHDGSSGLAERIRDKPVSDAQKDATPEEKFAELKVTEQEASSDKAAEVPEQSKSPSKIQEAKTRFSAKSLPPSSFSLNSLKKTPSKEGKATATAGDTILKRSSLRKVGLPEGELDMSASEPNHPSPSDQKSDLSAATTAVSPVKLQNGEPPAEKQETFARDDGDNEKVVMKRPSLVQVGIPQDGMDRSVKGETRMEVDKSAKSHETMDRSARTHRNLDESTKSHGTSDAQAMDGSHKSASVKSPVKEKTPNTAAVKPVKKTTSKGTKSSKTQTSANPAPSKPAVSLYKPTEEDFQNCANHEALLKTQEKEMERLRNEKVDLEKRIKKANKDFTKLENKLNTLKMVLDQGVKKEGMKNVWI